MSFVRAPNPIWYMVDHIGLPLNDTYYAHFLTNTLPYLPQNVYRDPQGTIVWTGNVVQFQPSGTLPDNLYFDPSLVYRIEIRQGLSQSDPLIWEINNFVPGEGGEPSNNLSILSSENQTTNPQFSVIDFVSPVTITTAGIHDIAPGWFLELVGAGSTTLTQLILQADSGIVGNPPFALRIDNSGWTEATLFQRLNHNGAIWANGAISLQFTARAQGSNETISANYVPNAGTPTVLIPPVLLTTGNFVVVKNAVDNESDDNATLSNSAYVDIDIVLPPDGAIDITNIQLVGQGNPLPGDFDVDTDIPLYQQQTEEREIDHTFHVYKNSILLQPKSSILAGWNFPLNPWQFRTTVSSNVATNTYTADCTLVIMQNFVASAAGNNVAVGRATFADNFAFEVKAVTPANKFALVQYIDPKIISPYWGQKLSTLAKVKLVTSHGTTVDCKIKLFYRAALPNTISQTDPIASWAANGEPVLAGGYTFIEALNSPLYTLDGTEQELIFNQFQLPASTNGNMTLGIMFYTLDNMDETATADKILFHEISLVRNDFAIAVQPETFDESLQKCQFYYESSYDPFVPNGTVTFTGVRFAEQLVFGSSPINEYARGFDIVFNTIKRASPIVHLYSPQSAAVDNVSVNIFNTGASSGYAVVGSSLWTQEFVSERSIMFLPNTIAVIHSLAQAAAFPEGILVYHYTANANLGI